MGDLEQEARLRMLGQTPTGEISQEDMARIRMLGEGGAAMAGRLKATRPRVIDQMEQDALMPPGAQVMQAPAAGAGALDTPIPVQQRMADQLRDKIRQIRERLGY